MACRKDHRALSTQERDRLVAGLHHLKGTGVVDAFADQHATLFGPIHGGSNFLPWHREFVRRFEDELRAFDPRITLPVWNWLEDRSTASSLWAPGFLGQFDAAWGLGRALGSDALPDAGTVEAVLGITPFAAFTSALERDAHNAPHRWVSGVMVDVASPGDPVFYLHHGFVDLLWAQWQLRHPGEPFQPSGGAGGVDAGDPLPGFPTTTADILDHRTIAAYRMPAGFVPDPPGVEIQPGGVAFDGVPEGELALRPARFALDGCGPVTLRLVDGPTLVSGPPESAFEALQPEVVASPEVDPTGRFWFLFRGTAPGDAATAEATLRCAETAEDFALTLTATTVERETTALALALDESNSMSFPSGIGNADRGEVLRFSAPPLVDVIAQDNAVAVYGFTHDPRPGIGVTSVATGRFQIGGAIAGHQPDPNGWTSIGEAVAFGHDLLAPVTDHPVKALVVLTDGQESHGDHDRRYIADVDDLVDERVYAIGLGRADAIRPAALQALCDGNEGYLLLTGDLDQDAYFLLAKYYQQILAHATNQQIVRDPEGRLRPKEEHRIPFDLTEADARADAVLLTPAPEAVRFAIETPDGELLGPGDAGANPGLEFGGGVGSRHYRMALPLPTAAGEARDGRWHAVLRLDEKGFARHVTRLREQRELEELRRVLAHGLRYNLSAYADSALRMRARIEQSGREPGASMRLVARLDEGSHPLRGADVRARLTRPGGEVEDLRLRREAEGTYAVRVLAEAPGIHRFDLAARGVSLRGGPFTREQILTGAVWRGGDAPPPTRDGRPARSRRRLCELLRCLLEIDGIRERLKREEIDPDAIGRCLEIFCRADPPAPNREREDLLRRLGTAMGSREVAERAIAVLMGDRDGGGA